MITEKVIFLLLPTMEDVAPQQITALYPDAEVAIISEMMHIQRRSLSDIHFECRRSSNPRTMSIRSLTGA